MEMRGYTKLFNSILASTIWREDDRTRIVWITMLAMADRDGAVEGSLPGLADMARVSVDDAEKAIDCLLSPDKYSRTKEFEGRRIAVIDGGWRILNHSKYREKMSQDERRAYNAQKQAEFRARQKTVSNSNPESITAIDKSAVSAHSESESDSKAESTKEIYSADFQKFWKHYPLKRGKGEAWRAWGRCKNRPAVDSLMAKVSAAAGTPQWQQEGGKFIPFPATWINQRRWDDEDETASAPRQRTPEQVSASSRSYDEDMERGERELEAARQRILFPVVIDESIPREVD